MNENEDPDDPIRRLLNSTPRGEWATVNIGGAEVRVSPNGQVSIYEISGNGVIASLANAADQGWADISISVEADATAAVSHESMQVAYDETSGEYIYVVLGLDPENSDGYPLVELRLHRRVALFLFAALFSHLEGEFQ